MAWISKKELKKEITELKKKVSELDSKKFPEELPEDIKEQIRGIVRGETEKFSNGLDKVRKDLQTTSTQLAELTASIKKFVSLTQETTKIALSRISEVIKETLESIEKKPEESTKPDDTGFSEELEQ